MIIGAFPASTYARTTRYQTSWTDEVDGVPDLLSQLHPSYGQPGTFFRDTYPLKSMVAFHQLAIEEVAAKGLDTCGDQLGMKFIESYSNSAIPYCVSSETSSFEPIIIVNTSRSHTHHSTSTPSSTQIWCTPNRQDGFTDWWPYPNSPCIATNLQPIKDEDRIFRAVGCEVTDQGKELLVNMENEAFLGNHMRSVDLEYPDAQCKDVVERTVMIIGRQDQWNPYVPLILLDIQSKNPVANLYIPP